jgi:E3 ubiquitin-protein ligase TRIP12
MEIQLWRKDSNYASETSSSDYLNLLFPCPVPVSEQTTEMGSKRFILFKALGTLVAKALLDSRVLDMPFSPTFIEMAVFGHASVQSMTAIANLDPSLHKSLSLLNEFIQQKNQQQEKDSSTIRIQGASIEDLCLDFTLPGYPDIELVPQGKHLTVKLDNLQNYIDKIIDFTIGEGIKPLVKAFRKGFNQVFPINDLHSFSTMELLMMMGGSNQQENWSSEG